MSSYPSHLDPDGRMFISGSAFIRSEKDVGGNMTASCQV